MPRIVTLTSWQTVMGYYHALRSPYQITFGKDVAVGGNGGTDATYTIHLNEMNRQGLAVNTLILGTLTVTMKRSGDLNDYLTEVTETIRGHLAAARRSAVLFGPLSMPVKTKVEYKHINKDFTGTVELMMIEFDKQDTI